MRKDQLLRSFARLLALGYRSGAVSTQKIQEEIAFMARLDGNDAQQTLRTVISHRDKLLAESGAFEAPYQATNYYDGKGRLVKTL